MEITYSRVGDYLLPNITLNEPPPGFAEPLGRYGQMHQAHLREHHPTLYSQLLLSERLYPLCREAEAAARERKKRGTPEECILSELVYT